jgi:hypothetical protein
MIVGGLLRRAEAVVAIEESVQPGGLAMRRLSCTLFALFLVSEAGPIGAAEEPRAVIERALKAMGRSEDTKQQVAVRMKIKGVMHVNGLTDQTIKIKGELFEFGPRSRVRFDLDLVGTKIQAVVVLDGERSWREIGGQFQKFTPEEIASLRASRHQDRVTGLTALLSDKAFTLTLLPEGRVERRPARVVRVSYKDEPDTDLYFDRETGLLVQYVYRARTPGDEKVTLHETQLSDYREPDLATPLEKFLREAGHEVTDDALLTFLRKQTPDESKLKRARLWVGKLGDDRFKVREQASAELVALGAVAVPYLREATKSDDREVVWRARECLKQLGEQGGKTLLTAAVRLLGLRRPPGTTQVLLTYLPAAEAEVAAEVKAVLFALGQQEGKPDPVLVAALKDEDPVRRAAAMAALGKDGGSYARQPGRRLYGRIHKIATKQRSWSDGTLQMEMEMFDHEFFNAFDEEVFARAVSARPGR